jgi:hypothetical protein
VSRKNHRIPSTTPARVCTKLFQPHPSRWGPQAACQFKARACDSVQAQPLMPTRLGPAKKHASLLDPMALRLIATGLSTQDRRTYHSTTHENLRARLAILLEPAGFILSVRRLRVGSALLRTYVPSMYTYNLLYITVAINYSSLHFQKVLVRDPHFESNSAHCYCLLSSCLFAPLPFFEGKKKKLQDLRRKSWQGRATEEIRDLIADTKSYHIHTKTSAR